MPLNPIDFNTTGFEKIKTRLKANPILDPQSFIVGNDGWTYFLDEIQLLSEDECHKSNLKFLNKDGELLTLSAVKTMPMDEKNNLLIHNFALAETLQSKKMIRCLLSRQGFLNPLITQTSQTYEAYALANNLKYNFKHNDYEDDHHGHFTFIDCITSKRFTLENARANRSLQSFIVHHYKHLLNSANNKINNQTKAGKIANNYLISPKKKLLHLFKLYPKLVKADQSEKYLKYISEEKTIETFMETSLKQTNKLQDALNKKINNQNREKYKLKFFLCIEGDDSYAFNSVTLTAGLLFMIVAATVYTASLFENKKNDDLNKILTIILGMASAVAFLFYLCLRCGADTNPLSQRID